MPQHLLAAKVRISDAANSYGRPLRMSVYFPARARDLYEFTLHDGA
ncbi:hypothetical protein EDD41_0589 [Luteococcus japonicus]|uniref:Uncharacterized protein n=1 Tax=Luteococcus japonicus TaxID=33984 RepID=A0A3N1ZRC3_9ACTN|nr:hypothetical protein [Luteococcus japonicus]ROR53440.1 hypothetical protein EDD41_0589 [Luteococcus japonicus]